MINITNGVSLSSVPLLEYCQRNHIYYDNLCMLDIEVSTAFQGKNGLEMFDRTKPTEYYTSKESLSLLYLWNMCIDGYLFSGRCLDDLLSFLECFNELLSGTFYIYIHNASYEFQFIRNILHGVDVFARETRKPIKFNWKNFEFRCSYMLTRLSLDTWGREKNLDVKKLTGQFNYTILRTPLTHLSVLERDYGYNDVLVGVCGLQEYKERYSHVKDIPLTQTSCIRKEVNKVMRKEYKSRLKVAAMTDIPYGTYEFLVKAFTGGYTHANILYANRVIKGLFDFDISSSYPWAMLSEQYPITPFIRTEHHERFMYNTQRYCYAMRIKLTGVKCKYFNTYISISKCENLVNPVTDNGRIDEADSLEICILDVDWEIIQKAYKIESYEILDFYYAIKGYLPDSFRRYLIGLFINKTVLKGNAEKYTLMFKSKEEINGCYGMGVTKDITDEITFTSDEWRKDELTIQKYYEKCDRKVKNISRLNLAYAQGIYVPAYGRKNLWHMVHLFDDEIVYMDTDSIKCTQDNEILKAIEEYNKNVHDKQRQLAESLGLTYEDFNPTDFKGVTHSIGTYERDEDIIRFKTLGAKRYVCEYDMSRGIDWLKMTVSGVRKKAVYQLNDIDDFKDGITFDIDNADKIMLIYKDNQPTATWNEGCYDEWVSNDRYGISAYNIPYNIGMSPDYLRQIAKTLSNNTQLFRR